MKEKEFSMKLIKKLLNRETLSYLFFGLMTTLVNYLTFFLCYNICSVPSLVANALAFCTAVLFAYTVNKLFVFETKRGSFSSLAKEFASFIGARLITFALEQTGLWISELAGLSSWKIGEIFSKPIDGITLAKVALSVIVVIVNFFLCKYLVFRKYKKSH